MCGIQANSIIRRHDGSPVAFTGSLWALNARNETTDVLGDYAEYWQPWSEVVDSVGMPKSLVYMPSIELQV